MNSLPCLVAGCREDSLSWDKCTGLRAVVLASCQVPCFPVFQQALHSGQGDPALKNRGTLSTSSDLGPQPELR